LAKESKISSKANRKKVVVTKNGPYLVYGGLPLSKEIIVVGKEGEPETWGKGEQYPRKEQYALCRCGASKTKPFCDGTHAVVGFNGKETASRKNYLEQAEKTSGPELILADAEKLCAAARFCHRGAKGGTWDLIEKSDDPLAKQIAIDSACNCPSGRLVVWHKNAKQPIEPVLEASLGLVEDPQTKTSGPIRLKGNVELDSTDGAEYETRNRMTLCRCGKSKNKPFCDGTHIKVKFSDGDKLLR
jgi:CDGSH-type Zn-finger protein